MTDFKKYSKYMLQSRGEHFCKIQINNSFNLPKKAFPENKKYRDFCSYKSNGAQIIFSEFEQKFQYPAIKAYILACRKNVENLANFFDEDPKLEDFYYNGVVEINNFGRVVIPEKFMRILDSKICENGIGENNLLIKGCGNNILIYRSTDNIEKIIRDTRFPPIN